MDDVNATRVTAPPAESAAERGDRKAVKRYAISVRVSTTRSAKHVTGLLLEALNRRECEVLTMRARMDHQPLVTYDKPRSDA